MNRKQRRKDPPSRNLAAADAPIPATLLSRANSHYADGRLDEADALSARHLDAQPGHVVALRMRGQIALLQQRPVDAVLHFTEALAAAPGAVAVHAGLAQALRASGQPVEAEIHYRRVAQLQPSVVTHLNLANVLLELQRPAEAAQACRLALRFDPHSPEAQYSLGIASMALGSEQAFGALKEAIARRPDFSRAHEALVEAYLAMNTYEAALQAAAQALVRVDTPRLRLLFVDCARDAVSPQDTPELREILRRALAGRWTRPQDLAPAICGVAVQRVPVSAPEEPLGTLLTLAPIPHRDVELALTGKRRDLLKAASSGLELAASDLATACSLARQCFINEYSWQQSEQELEGIQLLQIEVQACIDRQVAPSPTMLVVLAMYTSLASLTHAAGFLVDDGRPEVAAVLAQQVSEPAEELRLRDALHRGTPVDDEVSVAVRGQYESNPYPRWVATLSTSRQIRLGEWLQARFGIPAGPGVADGSMLDVLVAGCGTGQHAVETVLNLSDVNLLAIDLSLASLAYAARMTAALGIPGIEFMQADLLKVAQLGRSFDMIGVGGVLHHLADPWAGWRALLGVLRRGGVMNVLLYTVRGRSDVGLARDWIAARGYEATAAGIRACRHGLVTLDEDWAMRLTASPDFTSISGCRDLLFHVQERPVTLPEVARFLAEEAIELLGVEVPAATEQAFRAWDGDGDRMRDLSRWDLFETEHPRCFAAMLNLWVRKR